jgi:hypothetical protein
LYFDFIELSSELTLDSSLERFVVIEFAEWKLTLGKREFDIRVGVCIFLINL